MEETTYKQQQKYTSFDLMKIFGIKKGSWYNVKNKYNLDQYSEKMVDGKQLKYVYTQEAYDVLKENYEQKIVNEVKENPKMLVLLQENETLKATLSKYESLSSKFEKMYDEEKRERLKEIEKRNQIEQAQKELEWNYKRVQGNWNNYVKQNQDLKDEIERLKNRGFWARLFNK